MCRTEKHCNPATAFMSAVRSALLGNTAGVQRENVKVAESQNVFNYLCVCVRVSVLSQTQVFLSCLRLFICKISADQYSGLFTAALVLFLKMQCTVCKLCHFAYLSSKHEVSGTVYSTGINSYVVVFFDYLI